jgi:hypothetical protein
MIDVVSIDPTSFMSEIRVRNESLFWYGNLSGNRKDVLYRDIMNVATTAPDMHTKKSASKSSGAM